MPASTLRSKVFSNLSIEVTIDARVCRVVQFEFGQKNSIVLMIAWR